MKVNTGKTGMCVSDSQNFRDVVRIESGKSLKVLGWHFSDRPMANAQLEALKRKFRERY